MRIVDRLRAQLSINDLARSDRSRMEWEDPFKRERNKKESKDEDLNPSVYGMAGEAYKNDNQFEDTEMHMGMAVRASTDFYRKMKEVTGQIPRSPYSKYLDEHPDLETSEFEEYVVVNNRDDRDSGELADISKEEIERLGGEFLKSAQYSEYEQPRQIESPDPKPHADVKEYGSMNGPDGSHFEDKGMTSFAMTDVASAGDISQVRDENEQTDMAWTEQGLSIPRR